MTSEILRNEECNPNLLKKKGLELLDAGKTNEAVECCLLYTSPSPRDA